MAKGNSRMVFPKDDDKIFSRLSLSRERHNPSNHVAGESSFRVLYYGGAAGSVPFMWESQPGTPKHTFNDGPLPPPLTPPPSYQSSPRVSNPLLMQKKSSSKNSKILNSIFPSKKTTNAHNSPSFSPHSSSSSSSSFSSSYSAPSTPVHVRRSSSSNNNNTKARSKSTVQVRGYVGDEEEAGKYSPTSTLCFGPRSGSPSRRRMIKGYYYPIKSVKKVVLSIVGHGATN